MTARGTPSRFLRSVLQNGVGRYVCQLKRISIIFSKKAQSSLGISERQCEGGNRHRQNVATDFGASDKTDQPVGSGFIRIRKPFHTDNPSIQGQWHPFTNRPRPSAPSGHRARTKERQCRTVSVYL
ncbi:hypothetical protein INR49_027296 [Caranx melampygus]|nr:hypothetical protein INR49_027296 [Caranx melampygus]